MGSIVEQLRKSDKGQLKYFNHWSAEELVTDISPPKLRNKDGKVFEVHSIKIALEAIENDAQVYIENIDGEEQKKKNCKNEASQNESASEDEFENLPDVDAPLRAFEASMREDKRLADRLRAQRQEEFYAEISRKCLEAARIRRTKEQQKRKIQEERMKKYLRDNEGSAMRIKREMQDHEHRLLKTRQQQQEERRIKLQLLEMQKQKVDFQKFVKIVREIEALSKESIAKVQGLGSEIAALVADSTIPNFVENIELIFDREYRVLAASKAAEKITDDQLKHAESDLSVLKDMVRNLEREITAVNARFQEMRQKEEKAKQEVLVRRKKEAAEAERLAAEAAKTKPYTANLPQQTSSLKDVYKAFKAKMAEFESSGAELSNSNDRNVKTLIMNLSRVISVPIASITDRSGSDLKRCKRILVNVIKGEQVTVGNRTVAARENESIGKFAVNLVAKKIVSQANNQVSANFTSAFCIAFMVLGIWAESDDFGDLFMAHLHSKCIFSVPMTLLKTDSQSDEEYQKSMGYVVLQDGTIEQQDKYLRRMSGLVRLYAAVIQSPLPPGVSKHPHGLSKGWAWLAEMLNMEPQPDVSATVLYDFLEVAGHALMKSYKGQFEKLLYVICHDYYPKLEEVTGGEHRAPLIRLKNFLEKCIKEKSVPVPKGRLDKSFWNTYHSGGVVGE